MIRSEKVLIIDYTGVINGICRKRKRHRRNIKLRKDVSQIDARF